MFSDFGSANFHLFKGYKLFSHETIGEKRPSAYRNTGIGVWHIGTIKFCIESF